MGSGLCRTDGSSTGGGAGGTFAGEGSGGGREDGKPSAFGVRGLYRKMLLDYAKKWTRHTDKHSKNDKEITKHNKRGRKKLTISGPFPADPDRLVGEKWQHVILSKLDTEPAPARPPRTKRHRSPQDHRQLSGQQHPQTRASGRRRGSVLRRSRGRSRPRRPERRRDYRVDGGGGRTDGRLSAAELTALVLKLYRRSYRPTADRPLAWIPGRPRTAPSPATEPRPSTRISSRKTMCGRAACQIGFLDSIGRASAMANDLLRG